MDTRIPALYLGDRLSFSLPFLESALKMAQQHPESRTIFVRLEDVATNEDGAKVVVLKRNECPACGFGVDEVAVHHCPVGADGE